MMIKYDENDKKNNNRALARSLHFKLFSFCLFKLKPTRAMVLVLSECKKEAAN